MRSVPIGVVILFLTILVVICHAQTTGKQVTAGKGVASSRRCQKPKNGQHLCFCGNKRVVFDRLKGERCISGQVVQKANSKSSLPDFSSLRLTAKPIRQSARDDNPKLMCGLIFPASSKETSQAYVPLRNVSVEAWIDSFAADVTLTQVYVNLEENPIEAVYVFPLEENAAVYSFTAEIDGRIITAMVKEKKTAEKEYESAVQQGKTAVLMRQSEDTLDTFTINVGALPAGKECRVKIQYVTELNLIDGSSIRFVVPTTIAPRYNPSLGHLQKPDDTESEYVQKTPYSMWFQAHILRGEEYKTTQVANLSHPVNVSMSRQSIDISLDSIALDRDIILDIDLPSNRPAALVAMEQYNNSSKHAVLLAFTPRLSDFLAIGGDKNEANTEFIFIVDCSGSMMEGNRINLAREAMLLFIRSLPVGSNFNIIRFGSSYELLFKGELLTAAYNKTTAKQAEDLTRSMEANLGGTELLEPLKYLKDHPPIKDRSRQIFLLTDGEISNTNEVIKLCRSMASTTRIFSFGLGHSPSRSLVKGLARATNGHFVFVPPTAKVDSYVGSQFGRALQPSLVNVRLEWHGLSTNGSQAPKTIPPLYINDRVLVYEFVESDQLKKSNVSVDLMVGQHKINSIQLPASIAPKRDTIRRLAAKALIQELQHENDDKNEEDKEGKNSTLKERITTLSLNHQILSPYTAFVGVETTESKNNNTNSKVRHIPIQVSQGSEHSLFPSQPSYSYGFGGGLHGYPPMMLSQAVHQGQPMSMSASYARARPSFKRGPSGYAANHYNGYPMADDSDEFMAPQAVVPAPSADPVRWLINQQSFDGAWLLKETDIATLSNGKSFRTFTSKITTAKDALTTAFAIALLESKHAAEKNLWFAVAEKGRKHLLSFGLSNDQVDILINEMKTQL